MVNENRVKLMTRLAIFEKHESKRGLVMSRYYKNDYVRFNVLKTIVAATVAYWVIVGATVFVKFDDILGKINDIDYFDTMYKLLGIYVVFCVVYFIFATLLYNYRYQRVKPGLIDYNSNLRDLIEAEGGPMHRSKLVEKEKAVTMQAAPARQEKRTKEQLEESRRTTVSRSQMVQQQLQAQEEEKRRQIIQNMERLNARAAQRQSDTDMKERELLEEKRRIHEKRMQLEREQMERIRQERQSRMVREDHTYSGNSQIEGRDE